MFVVELKILVRVVKQEYQLRKRNVKSTTAASLSRSLSLALSLSLSLSLSMPALPKYKVTAVLRSVSERDALNP